MRLIWHGVGWALVAIVCLGVAGYEYYLQWDFVGRAVLTEAEITEREAFRQPGSQLVWQRWRYAVDVSYLAPDGGKMAAHKRVSWDDYVGLEDHPLIWVDPAAPSEIQLHGDEYASTALYAGLAAMAAAALSALALGLGVFRRRARALARGQTS